jgi:O-antigen/teichoic acid export membrane protein
MGRGYALYGMLLITLLQADTLLIGWLGGAVMVAEFVLVWKIADVVIQTLWRIPESLQPYLVQMDARGEMARMRRLFDQGQKWLTVMGILCGGLFALLGPYLVELWVGAEQAPDSRLAYVLAGGAIFWSVSARLPAIYGFSLVRLAALNRATGIELAARVAMTLALFPFMGYLAPLIAVNVAHASGVAALYRRIVPETRKER